jgi:hypothetical protein
MKTKKQAATDDKSRDRAYILDFDHWGAWPYCPLKRGNCSRLDKNLGFLLATEEHADACKGKGKFVVYLAYMFAPPKGKEEYDACPKLEYDSVDALLADGWMVD